MNNAIQLSFLELPDVKNDFNNIVESINSGQSLSLDEFGHYLKNWSKSAVKKTINTLGLFSGAGGLDIGFCDTGFNLVESVEIERKFVETMRLNKASGKYFHNANIICDDIRNYNPTKELDINFIIGGPPCQSFSSAGRRAAGVRGTKDARGSLFEEYVRVLEILQPTGFLFENVYGLLGAEKGKAIEKIKKAFEQVGYKISYRVLDTADFGVPQHRERLIIVGARDFIFKFPKPTHGPDALNTEHLSAFNAITGLASKIMPNKVNGRFGHLLDGIPPGLNYSYYTEKMGHPQPLFAWRSKFSDFLYKADPNTPIRTLKASGGQYTGPFHWDNRPFDINELKRLQTFPDNYDFFGGKGDIVKQIGNSVPPQFARILALAVLEQFFNVELPFELKYLSENENLTFRKLKSSRTKAYLSKASKAIEDINSNVSNVEIREEEYVADLLQDMRLLIQPDGAFKVHFSPNKNEWKFFLGETDVKQSFAVTIKRSNKKPLFNDVMQVVIAYSHYDVRLFSAGWKAFERNLIKYHLKADLVQLNGYYQYQNNIIYSFDKTKDPVLNQEFWSVLECIMNDNTIGQIHKINNLAVLYNVNTSNLKAYLEELKLWGFEIRNHNTNPEIPVDHYLIPYKFPSLNRLSVQLKTKL